MNQPPPVHDGASGDLRVRVGLNLLNRITIFDATVPPSIALDGHDDAS